MANQMHPFIQHFNNIMRSDQLLLTFDDCAEQLKLLNQVLNVPATSSLQTSLVVTEFPGLTQIKFQQLYPLWLQFSSSPLNVKSSKEELLQKANFLLSHLQSLRRLFNLQDENLITGAQHVTFSQQFSLLSGSGDAIQQVQILFNQLYGDDQQIPETMAQFTDKFKNDLNDLQSALLLICHIPHGEKKSIFELFNEALQKLNYQQIQYIEVEALGCESQLKQEELFNLMQIAQQYVVPSSRRISTNCLQFLINWTAEIVELLQGPAICNMLVIIQKNCEVNLFTLQQLNKEEYFSYFMYILTGELQTFNEEDFYVQAVSACDAFQKVVKFAFKDQTIQKCTKFDNLLDQLYKLMKPHSFDKIDVSFVLERDFEIFDSDLKRFLKDLGGTKNAFQLLLKLWLLGKSIFEDCRSLLEFIARLVFEIVRPNGCFQEKISEVNEICKSIELCGDQYDVQVLLSKVGCMIAQ